MSDRIIVRSDGTRYVVRDCTDSDDGDGGGQPFGAVGLIAGEALSGHRVITIDDVGEAVYASAANGGDVSGPFFLTTGAVAAAADFDALVQGEVIEPSWAWAPGAPLYLGLNGQLTAVVPELPADFSVRVATALTATSLFFDPEPPIVLT